MKVLARNGVGCLLAIAAFLVLALPAFAQDVYPSKPIHMLIPFPPGGSLDPLARLISQKLTEAWGQPIIVDNRPGGNAVIGTELLLRAPPDGYTILMTSTSHVTNPSLLPVSYDALKDFAPIGMVSTSPLVLVVHPSVPATNLKELIALAKAKPGTLNYASSGTGSINHLMGELFDIEAGVKTQHVPYKGGGESMNALLGGQVQMSFALNAPPYVQTGRLRALAVTGSSRMPGLPDVPTFAEAGLPGVDGSNWLGVFVVAGTPKPIVDKLVAMFARILAMPDVRDKIDAIGTGMEVKFVGPDAFATFLRADMARYAKLIHDLNIKLN